MKTTILTPALGALIVAGMASTAAATTLMKETFDLTVNGCSKNCFPSAVTDLGTVTVTETKTGALDFSVDFTTGAFKAAGKSGTHHSLVFNITSTGKTDPIAGLTITVPGTEPKLTGSTAGGIKDSPFGSWDDSVDYTGPLHSNGTINPTSLFFVVTDSAGNLSLNNLTANNISKIGAIYLAADVYAASTGNVGARAGMTSIATPEPASWALMHLGVGLTGASLRARRRSASAPVRV